MSKKKTGLTSRKIVERLRDRECKRERRDAIRALLDAVKSLRADSFEVDVANGYILDALYALGRAQGYGDAVVDAIEHGAVRHEEG